MVYLSFLPSEGGDAGDWPLEVIFCAGPAARTVPHAGNMAGYLARDYIYYTPTPPLCQVPPPFMSSNNLPGFYLLFTPPLP